MLAPTVLVFGLINPLGWLLTSIGLQKRSLTIALVIAPVVMTAYVLGLPYGFAGVAFPYSAAMVLWVIPHVLWCLNGTTISARDLFWATWRPFLSAVVAAAFAFGAQFYIGDEVAPLLSLVLGGGIMAAVYLSMLLFGMGRIGFI